MSDVIHCRRRKGGYVSLDDECKKCKTRDKCKEFASKKEGAISHITESTLYWAGDNIHSDSSFSCPSNLGLKNAFKTAVWHVKQCHFPYLTKKDIEKAKHIVEKEGKKAT